MSVVEKERSSFSGRVAFVLAASASAIGLGNLWRFPYLAAKYGGGAFLIVYLFLVVTFGFALMVAEVALGRKTRLSTIGAYKSFGKKYAFIGILASIVPFIITPYYCLIGGWVMKYAAAYATQSADTIAADGYFTSFITSAGPETFLWMLLFIAITIAITALGVQGGIERSNKILMPLLFVISIGISVYAMTLPGALDGVKYFLIPDFSKFSIEMVVAAMGQVFFSLSLSMGIMVTYGSYMNRSDNLEGSVRNTEIFDTLIAFLAGLMIIPPAFSVQGTGEAVAQNAGPGLMFVVLPQLFEGIPVAGRWLGLLFFLLVFFAALTSSISLFEACLSIVKDGLHCSRRRAIVYSSIFLVIVAIIVDMGYNVWLGVDPMNAIFGIGAAGDHQILDFFDFVSNTVLMPIVALLTCIFVGWIIKPKAIIEEVESEGVVFHGKVLFTVMIKYIVPVFMVAILVGYVLSTIGVITL